MVGAGSDIFCLFSLHFVVCFAALSFSYPFDLTYLSSCDVEFFIVFLHDPCDGSTLLPITGCEWTVRREEFIEGTRKICRFMSQDAYLRSWLERAEEEAA
jgi:hypothetical protein